MNLFIFFNFNKVSIIDGASEADLKSSLNLAASSTNSHFSDDNEDGDNNPGTKSIAPKNMNNTVITMNDEYEEKPQIG